LQFVGVCLNHQLRWRLHGEMDLPFGGDGFEVRGGETQLRRKVEAGIVGAKCAHLQLRQVEEVVDLSEKGTGIAGDDL